MEQIELKNTDNSAITLLPKEDRKSPATLQDIMNLQDDIQEVTSPKKPIFGREIVEGDSVGLAELMGLDYDELPGFVDFMLSLVNEYELFRLTKKQNPYKCVWEVVQKNGIRSFNKIDRYDCFNFTWLVYYNLIEQGLLPPGQDSKIAGRFRTVDIVKEAIEKSILFEVGEFTKFNKKSGFVYYNISEDGFEKTGKRHCGFYIINKDKSVSFIHVVNTKDKKGGGRERKFQNIREFKDHLLRQYSAYSGNPTNSIIGKNANLVFRKLRDNIGHYDRRKVIP
jgi:hypothetical protein